MSASAILGLVIMIVSEGATLAQVEPFYSWNTPICWTGFILFADGLVYRARGDSWLRSAPREFTAMALASIPLWVVFEGFNLRLNNWHYTGLPMSPGWRTFGYAWAFATISPAIFECAELVSVVRHPAQTRVRHPGVGDARVSAVMMAAGAIMLVSPFLVSPFVARYLAAPVWLGFILLLDPVNRRLGAESIVGDVADRGSSARLVNLLLSGLVCGVLWEFWNYWSGAKWHYTVPIMEHVKIFEMPLPGYLGFPPFAVECFAMYVFVRAVFLRVARLDGVHARTIGV